MARIGVRSYERKDGTAVRAHTRSGGGGTVAVVAVVAAAVGIGALPPAQGPTTAQLTVKVQDRTARSQQSMTGRLGRKAYQVRARGRFDGSDCAGHAYGSVAAFFRDRPCLALARMVFEVRDRRGRVALVAVSAVGMPDEAGARAYRKLVDRHGTGNITELSREQGRYRSVRFAGVPYVSRRDDHVVTNVQVQPVGPWPEREVLKMFAATALA